MALSKSTYAVGVTGALLCALGSMFKAMHYPGASFMLLLGVAIFNFGFLIVWIVNTFKGLGDPKEKTKHIFGIAALFTCILGLILVILSPTAGGVVLIIGVLLFIIRVIITLFGDKSQNKFIDYLGIWCFLLLGLSLIFRVQHYPGSSIMLIVGTLSYCVYLPMFFSKKFDELAESNRTGIMSMLLVGTVFISLILPVRSPRELTEAFVQIDQGLVQQTVTYHYRTDQLYDKIESWSALDSLNYPSPDLASSIRNESDALHAYMEDLKLELIMWLEDTRDLEQARYILEHGLYYAGDIDKASTLFLNTGRGNILRKELVKLREFYLANIEGGDAALVKIIEKLINTDDPPPRGDDPQYSWESHKFEYLPASAVITNLSLMQSGLRNAEYLIIDNLWKNSQRRE